MKNSITQEEIDELIEKAEITQFKAFDKCLVVIVKLENGFVLTESSACVDPVNFDETIGYDICINRIKNKLWELNGYYLQHQTYLTIKVSSVFEEYLLDVEEHKIELPERLTLYVLEQKEYKKLEEEFGNINEKLKPFNIEVIYSI